MSDSVIIREARLTDYVAVMALGDVYGGHDYLGAYYNFFINDPATYPVVATLNGKVIGFQFHHVIDEGQSVTGRAGRVHKDYRRLGVMHKMAETFEAVWPRLRPTLKYRNFVVTYLTPSMEKNFKNSWISEIFRKRVKNFKLDSSQLKNLAISNNEISYVARLSKNGLLKIFNNKDTCEKFFPKGLIFNQYMQFRLLRGNIDLLINQFADVYVTTTLNSNSPKVKPDPSSSNFDPNNMEAEDLDDYTLDKIDTISFAHHYPTFGWGGWVYEIVFYSKPGSGIPKLDLHIRLHLQAFAAMSQGHGALILTCNTGNDDLEMAVSVLKVHGVSEPYPNPEQEIHFFERSITGNAPESKL